MSEKVYKNISGTWTEIDKVYKNVSGAWTQIKKIHKKISGAWTQVYSSTVEYAFTSSLTATASNGLLLSDYISPSLGSTFEITVDSGVTLTGLAGTDGADGVDGDASHHDGYDGVAGGLGGAIFNLTDFSGKTVTFINNGTLVTGAGGAGGDGGDGYSATGNCDAEITNGGVGGAGGAGGVNVSNESGVTYSFIGTAVTTGTTGATGATGVDGEYHDDDCGTCFVEGQPVRMADGADKNIEDVRVGDKVLGPYNDINTVMYLDMPKRGNRDIWAYNDLLTTIGHPIMRGDRKSFYVLSIKEWLEDYGDTVIGCLEPYGDPVIVPVGKNYDVETLRLGDFVATVKETEEITRLQKTAIRDDQLYHLIVDGSKSYSVSGIFVSSFSDDAVDYKKLGESYETR